jgi:hypothetical protein
MNGKGDKDRTSDRKRYNTNYDKINWKKREPLSMSPGGALKWYGKEQGWLVDKFLLSKTNVRP